MDKIQKILNEAESLGLKDQLLSWTRNNKDWDPSLQNDLERYYFLGLKILIDLKNKKHIEDFNDGYWKTKGHINDKTETGRILELLNSYSLMHQNNSFPETNAYSQIGQDLFVINFLKQKRNGLFLDIGGGPPMFINNTYLLEKKYDWDGISIDLDHRNKVAWENSDRISKFMYENAFEVDYNALIEQLLLTRDEKRIDYLSLDLEPPNLTLEALYKIITSTKRRFTIITFEHDGWRGYDHVVKTSREFLESHNYQLIVENINNQEDWYIDKTY